MEDFRKFTDQKDPTKILDLSSISLEDQYTKLTDEEKLMVGCSLLGLNRCPCTIDQFLEDSYFLGSEALTNGGHAVFNFWREHLRDIFPNQIITRFPYISLGGSIGAGKSTVSRLALLYIYHRIDCAASATKSLHLMGGAKIAMVFTHANTETVEREYIRYIKEDVFENSPYFGNLYNLKKNQIRLVAAGPKSNSIIGLNVVASIMSEIGHINPRDGVARVSEVLTRVESRFRNVRFNFVLSICDSSAKDEDNRAVKAFEEGCPPSELKIVKSKHWEVRPELYFSETREMFKLYLGDSVREPYIIEDENDIQAKNLDPDRIIEVPVSAKYRFMTDLIRGIRDICGISYSYENKFFKSLEPLIKCSTIHNLAPEIVTVDFYDKTDTIFDKVSPMIYRIPRGTSLFMHLDIGLKSDLTACSICYYTGETMVGNASLPTFKFPLILGISRKAGQSTSIDHLYQFIKDIIRNGYTVTVSADSFASAGLFQSCERDGIDYRCISVDRTMDAGIMFKNVVSTGRAELVYHNRLLREASEIMVVGNGKNGDHIKLDHPQFTKSTEFDMAGRSPSESVLAGKDMFDSVCGSLWSCYQKYAEYKEGGPGAGVMKSMQALEHVTRDPREESAKVFQNMLENIF